MKKVNLKLISMFIAFICLGLGLLIIGNKLVQSKKETITQEVEKSFIIKPKGEKESEIVDKKLPDIKEKTPRLTPEDKEIDTLIERLKSDDFSISQEAADRLVSLGRRAIPKLIEILRESSVALKGQIIFILGRIGDKKASPILMETLRDENTYIRRNAAEALGKIRDEYAIPGLTITLFDEDGGVRERSAWALGEIGDFRTTGDLIDRMTDEKEERVKSAVVDAFAKLKDQRATPTLLTELSSKSDQLYKNEVVVALGEIRDSRALSELTAYLDELKKYKEKPIEKEDELAELTKKMIDFQLEQAIKIAEEAIEKIQDKE